MKNKALRLFVFEKYDGKCAYCGCELVKGWNADHITPKAYGGGNELRNLNPSCKECNNYKRYMTVQEFRYYAKQMFNDKLEYLFKSKTKMQIAINMGVIKIEPWDGVFYFERFNK